MILTQPRDVLYNLKTGYLIRRRILPTLLLFQLLRLPIAHLVNQVGPKNTIPVILLEPKSWTGKKSEVLYIVNKQNSFQWWMCGFCTEYLNKARYPEMEEGTLIASRGVSPLPADNDVALDSSHYHGTRI